MHPEEEPVVALGINCLLMFANFYLTRNDLNFHDLTYQTERLHHLLHRHALRQVTRLVYIRAFLQGGVIRQQLQRHGVQNR